MCLLSCAGHSHGEPPTADPCGTEPATQVAAQCPSDSACQSCGRGHATPSRDHQGRIRSEAGALRGICLQSRCCLPMADTSGIGLCRHCRRHDLVGEVVSVGLHRPPEKDVQAGCHCCGPLPHAMIVERRDQGTPSRAWLALRAQAHANRNRDTAGALLLGMRAQCDPSGHALPLLVHRRPRGCRCSLSDGEHVCCAASWLLHAHWDCLCHWYTTRHPRMPPQSRSSRGQGTRYPAQRWSPAALRAVVAAVPLQAAEFCHKLFHAAVAQPSLRPPGGSR